MSSHPSLDAALGLLAAGRADLAERACRDLLDQAPGTADALLLLAVLLCRRAAFAEAEPLLLEVLAARPDDPQALETLGDLRFEQGDFAAAADGFARALAARPMAARFWVKLAQAHSRAGRLAEAVAAYRRGLDLEPGRVDLWCELGGALAGAGQGEEAAAAFAEATRLAPDSARAWRLLADQLGALGRAAEAEAAYRATLARDPGDIEAQVNLARLFRAQNRLAEARAALEAVRACCPEAVPVLTALAALRLAEGDNPGAAALARQVVALEPGNFEGQFTLGLAALGLDRPEEAEAAFRRALAIAPNAAPALTNLGLTRWGQGAGLAEAAGLLERALALDPANADAWTILALIRLQSGDFDRGWTDFHWRLATFGPGWDRRYAELPRWDGTPPGAGRLLVSAEQGIGDQVMFAGFLPGLLARGIALAIEADPRLEPLFLRSFPTVAFVPLGQVERLPGDVAVQLPCGDLPALLRPDRGPVPWLAESYLRPDPALRDRLRRRYADGRLLAGLAWRSTQARTGARRSLDPARLAPLLAVPGVRWISLQYGDAGAGETSEAGAEVTRDPAVDQMADPDAFAAQIAALDLVVTIDNSTAHFAGALGVPTLLLNPCRSDWRWFLGGRSSPWYPSLTVLRQPVPGAWDPVVAEAAAWLGQRVAAA
ncbi:tetratricopeptide repeat protein [Phaeospirillum tilakii]|uniref:Tetratricopeptide repeat protein n=1 Tax=Phaeospirillum tilakii TaxID=741673 RepID=A0ABW5CCI5_9PROT